MQRSYILISYDCTFIVHTQGATMASQATRRVLDELRRKDNNNVSSCVVLMWMYTVEGLKCVCVFVLCVGV